MAALLAAFGLVSATARGQAPTVDVDRVLEQADAATRAVGAVEYDVEYYATGEYEERVPKVTAHVMARQGRRGFFAHPTRNGAERSTAAFRFAGSVHAARSDFTRSFDVATDGHHVVSIEMESKRYVAGDDDAMQMVTQVKPLFMLEFFHSSPFHDEMTGREKRYEGVKKIGDVECDVIYVEYQRPYLDARWYFGREDHLPRRVDRIIFRGTEAIGERVLSLTNLNTTPTFEADAFNPPAPPGFDRCAFTSGKRLPKGGHAMAAPDFTLKTPDGSNVRLSELRGNVVVLDFWSTWCLPCKLSMPQLQKLHDKYRDQPVKIFGLNCWDKDGDPAKFMKDNEYTYGLLLEADDVARDYGVQSIPAVFVIDPDGKICYSQPGVVPSLERKIERAIERALKKTDADSDE